MGTGSSTSGPALATLFGAGKEVREKRGPTLGCALLRSPDCKSWHVALAAPLGVNLYDAQTAAAVAPSAEVAGQGGGDAAAAKLKRHAPFTAFCLGDDESEPFYAIGCQDGYILLFNLHGADGDGPFLELHCVSEDRAGEESLVGNAPAIGVTVLLLQGRSTLFAGCYGRCCSWDIPTGAIKCHYDLPRDDSGAAAGSSKPPVPSAMCLVQDAAGCTQLWVGSDHGHLAIFDAHSGDQLGACQGGGSDVVVSLVAFPAEGVVFALNAHRRVTAYDVANFDILQKYPAELITCGADLSVMISARLQGSDTTVLLLAGVDGSLCARRVLRRADHKISCLLLCHLEAVSSDPDCPITALSYHASSDCLLVGDAGCCVTLVSKLKEQLGSMVMALPPGSRSQQEAARLEPQQPEGVAQETAGGTAAEVAQRTAAEQQTS